MRANGQHTVAAVMNLRFARDTFFAEHLRKLVGAPRVRDGYHFRLMAFNLAEQFSEVGSGGKRNYGEPSRVRLHDRKALAANRTRRAQDRNLLHEVSDSLFE